MDLWARRKGIHIVGTGDFTHPAWRKELKEKLTLAEDGLYVLKEEYRIRDGMTPDSITPRFVLTGEISSIYKKNGRVRKVHNLILLPDMETAQQAAKRLEVIGNIHSDGRPILGLDWQRPAGAAAGHVSGYHLGTGPYLDAPFFRIRRLFRL